MRMACLDILSYIFSDFHTDDGGPHLDEDCAFFSKGYDFEWADAPCTSHTSVYAVCEMS